MSETVETPDDGDVATHLEQAKADEAIDQQRLEAIFSTRENADQRIEQLSEAVELGEVDRRTAHVVMFRSVRGYIRQLEGLLTGLESGAQFWEEVTIGTWTIEAPSPAALAQQHKRRANVGTMHAPTSGMPAEYELLNEGEFDDQTVELRGLASIFETRPIRRVDHTAEFQIRFRGRATVTETVESVVPMDIIEGYHRAANRFSQQIGLDVHMKDTIDVESEPW